MSALFALGRNILIGALLLNLPSNLFAKCSEALKKAILLRDSFNNIEVRLSMGVRYGGESKLPVTDVNELALRTRDYMNAAKISYVEIREGLFKILPDNTTVLGRAVAGVSKKLNADVYLDPQRLIERGYYGRAISKEETKEERHHIILGLQDVLDPDTAPRVLIHEARHIDAMQNLSKDGSPLFGGFVEALSGTTLPNSAGSYSRHLNMEEILAQLGDVNLITKVSHPVSLMDYRELRSSKISLLKSLRSSLSTVLNDVNVALEQNTIITTKVIHEVTHFEVEIREPSDTPQKFLNHYVLSLPLKVSENSSPADLKKAYLVKIQEMKEHLLKISEYIEHSIHP